MENAETPKPPGFYPNFDARTVTAFHKNQRTNKHGYLGVRYSRRNKCFEATIRDHVKGKKIHCGSGKTPEAAALKYDLKARLLYGDEAITNFEKNDTRYTPCPFSLTGGRPKKYYVSDILLPINNGPKSYAEWLTWARLSGFSDSTFKRLVQEACKSGAVTKSGRKYVRATSKNDHVA